MAKVNRKRFRLGCLIDRLHVENAISSKKHNRLNREQVGLETFVNPTLLQNKKCDEVVTVKQDLSNGKVKNQVHTRSKNVQAKHTEGGSVVCQLCGNQSFKSFPKTLEVNGDNGKPKQVVKQVCRKCYAPDDGTKYKETDTKRRCRPYYEPPLIGVVGDRASKSWHFIRRDYVCRKKNELHKDRCNENEFSEKYLSNASSDESDLSECDNDNDDDDDDDDDDEEEDFEDVVYSSDDDFLLKNNRFFDYNTKYLTNTKRVLSLEEDDIPELPEIHRPGHSYINDLRNHKGYQDHLALRNEWCSDSGHTSPPNITPTSNSKNDNDDDDYDRSPNTSINRPVDLENIGSILADHNRSFRGVNLELAVNQNESDRSTVALPINVEDSPIDHSHYCHPTVVINDDEKINSVSSSVRTIVTKSVHNISSTSEDEYVEVECVDDDNIEYKLLEDIDLALEILLVDCESTQLLSPPNSIDNDLYNCFENKQPRIRLLKNVYNKNVIKPKDHKVSKSKSSYDKGVCRLVTVVKREKSDYKDGSSNSSFYDSQGIFRKKQELPSFIQLDDTKRHKKKTHESRKKEIDNLLLKYCPSTPPPPSPVEVINSYMTDVDSNLTLKELQDKFWPNRLSAGASKENVCDICSRYMLSCSTYDRNKAPKKLIPFFKDAENKIRACKACILTTGESSETDGSDVTMVTGTRRPLLHDKKDVPVPSKSRKLSEGNIRILPKIRHFSRFSDLPKFTSRSVAPKFIRNRNNSCSSIAQNQPKIIGDSIPTGTISLNDDIGKILIKNSSPQSPLGINSFGRLNLKVVQNPNENEIKNIAQNCKTKYVIVQTAPNSGESKVQKLSTDKNSGEVLGGETKLGSHGDITINGQRYKIDTEFKLNDLVKDNENAFLSAETQKDLLNRLPSILQRTATSKGGIPTHFRIVNVVENTPTSIGTSVSSPSSLSSPPRPQTIIVQSIAPGQTNPSIQTIGPAPPKIISNVKGSAFQSTVSDYSVNPVKKLQNIAPAPPKVSSQVNSSSYVADGSIIGGKNVVSYVDTSVYPRVTNSSVIGTKRHAVLLPASKLDPVVLDTSNKHAKILPALKHDPVVIDVKPKNPVKNLVEIRLPENTVQRPSRKVILNSPVDSIKYIPSDQTNTPTNINLSSSLNESVCDSKISITTSNNPGSTSMNSLYGFKTPVFTNQKFTSGTLKSSAATTISNTCLNRSVSEMKESATKYADTVSLSLVKSINASATTKMTGTSSSLVKSINELRASLNTLSSASPPSMSNIVSRATAITINNNTTPSSMTKSINNTHASITTNIGATSISHGKSLKPVMKQNTKSFVIAVNELKTSVISKTYTTSPPLVKSVSNLKVAITTSSIAASTPGKSAYVTSSTTANNLLTSISRQIQQQIKTTSPSKSHIVKISSQSNNLPTSTSPIKTSMPNQNGDKQTGNNQVLELSNGIKIVGTYLNTESTKPRMDISGKITPRGNMTNQTNTSIASQNK